MSTRLRRKRANSVVWGLLALVMLGLGGYGVTNFSSSNEELGRVGDRTITLSEYARALQREVEAFSAQVGQRIGIEQAQALGIDRAVLSQVMAAATLEDQAQRLGVSVGDAQVRERILSAPAFQGPDGSFSRDAYTTFLRSQGMSEAQFETSLRDEAAATLLQGAVAGGATAPAALVDRIVGWAAETRSFTLAELLPSDLSTPVAAPTDADLQSWYDAHGDSYMRPETRMITYVWLKPEDILDQVEVDEETLKAAYDERRTEFVVPERRLVARLVFPTAEEAAAARARFDSGAASFAQLAEERGLSIDDVDLGEVEIADLGTAGDAVFAMTEPGVVGPVETDLGPALYAMNGVLSAQETTFEDARDDLRAEVAMDRARRMIADKQDGIEDLLASGATLEEVAGEAGMELGEIEFNAETEGGLSAYEAFRTAAGEVTEESFPTLIGLDDGGIFAIRLDSVAPAALRPLDEVRDRVAADWTADATHAALLALAGEDLAQIQNGATLETLGRVTTRFEDLPRDGFVSDAPPEVAARVFAMVAGNSEVLDAGGRVFLLSLASVTPADAADAEVQAMRGQVSGALAQGIGRDVFDQFVRAAQDQVGVVISQQAIAAVNARMQ